MKDRNRLRKLATGSLLVLATAMPAAGQICTGPVVSIDGTAAGSHPSISGIVDGNVTGSATIGPPSVYVISNVLEVKSGGTLTVLPNTCVFGDATNEPSALIVRQGGKLIADGGAPGTPIVFSSANDTSIRNLADANYQSDPGNPLPGDWGGVVIIGRSTCNGLGDDPIGAEGDGDGIPNDCEVEGVDSTVPGVEDFDAIHSDGNGRLLFGGDLTEGNVATRTVLPNDDSGTLRYVRIAWGGFQIDQDNEMNVLTLFSVGAGTTIENVHVKGGSDDGLELFGGTVNLKNIVATLNSDDSIDYSYGWTGRAQGLLVQQFPNGGIASDTGFEVDGNEAEGGDEAVDYVRTPRTNPAIYNVTIIGQGDAGSKMMVHRRGTQGLLQNGLVAEGAIGLDVDDAETFAGCTGPGGDLFLDNFRFSDGTVVPQVVELFDTDADNEVLCVGSGFSKGITYLPAGAVDRTAPDFVPIQGLTGATPPANGFFDTTQTFLGAAAAGGTPFWGLGSWAQFGN